MKEKFKRLQEAAERLLEVQDAVWWYYRPHLISITIEKYQEYNDEGGYYPNYFVKDFNPDYLDTEYCFLPSREEPLLECILKPHPDYTIDPPDIEDYLPLKVKLNDYGTITLINTFPSLKQIEDLLNV